MQTSGRDRLERRHRLHVIVRETIDRWNGHAQVMHLGHRINLCAEITEAVMAHLDSTSRDSEKA